MHRLNIAWSWSIGANVSLGKYPCDGAEDGSLLVISAGKGDVATWNLLQSNGSELARNLVLLTDSFDFIMFMFSAVSGTCCGEFSCNSKIDGGPSSGVDKSLIAKFSYDDETVPGLPAHTST